jgi:ABC-type transporter Mla subunit MlaD
MNGRRTPMQALASSPTMVGAITTLIVVVAVFLAYNANQGLPFVPVYRVAVEIPNAARLANNNEVRIGGHRVGVVETIEAVKREGDASAQTGESDAAGTGGPESPEVVARLNLKLDESAGPLPKNSIFRVRYRSAFGLKYLEITRGDGDPAPEGFTFIGTDDVDDPSDQDSEILSLDEVAGNPGAENGTFIEQTEFDDIGNTFDQRTRNAARQNLLGYGDAFAGRGSSLNLAIESLNPLLTNLRPVAAALAAPETQLRRFFPALARTARLVAPVAEQNAELFTNMAITFAAISRDPEALKESISEGPATLDTGIRILPAQQVFLSELSDLQRRLGPGVRQLRLALPDLNQAVRVGTPVLRRTPVMNRRLEQVFRRLEELVEQPSTMRSIRRLRRTFNKAAPLAAHVAPAQTVCNYWNYMWTLLPEHLTEEDSIGNTQRVSLISTPPGSLQVELPPPLGLFTLDGEVETGLSIAGYSGVQANGRYGPAAPPPHTPGEFDPHELPILHANPTAPTGQDGRNCQPGQTGYLLGDLRLPGQPRHNPTVGVPRLPGNRGPTTAYWEQDGTRILKDTRVNARQP